MAQVALTIDVEQDAPPFFNTWRGVEKGLPLMLETLAKHDVPVTFFITGQAAEDILDLLLRFLKGTKFRVTDMSTRGLISWL